MWTFGDGPSQKPKSPGSRASQPPTLAPGPPSEPQDRASPSALRHTADAAYLLGLVLAQKQVPHCWMTVALVAGERLREFKTRAKRPHNCKRRHARPPAARWQHDRSVEAPAQTKHARRPRERHGGPASPGRTSCCHPAGAKRKRCLLPGRAQTLAHRAGVAHARRQGAGCCACPHPNMGRRQPCREWCGAHRDGRGAGHDGAAHNHVDHEVAPSAEALRRRRGAPSRSYGGWRTTHVGRPSEAGPPPCSSRTPALARALENSEREPAASLQPPKDRQRQENGSALPQPATNSTRTAASCICACGTAPATVVAPASPFHSSAHTSGPTGAGGGRTPKRVCLHHRHHPGHGTKAWGAPPRDDAFLPNQCPGPCLPQRAPSRGEGLQSAATGTPPTVPAQRCGHVRQAARGGEIRHLGRSSCLGTRHAQQGVPGTVIQGTPRKRLRAERAGHSRFWQRRLLTTLKAPCWARLPSGPAPPCSRATTPASRSPRQLGCSFCETGPDVGNGGEGAAGRLARR